MKRHLTTIAVVLLSIVWAQAQPGKAGGMGGPPPGPGLSASTAKLFGDNSTFSAALEMQTSSGGADSMSMPGKIYFDHGKTRFEMDLSEVKGSKMPPQAAASMKSMGMDKMLMISRPDKRVGYQVYPGLQAYVETALPEREASAPDSDFKVEFTEVGKETFDGHPCIKNKAVVTDKDGTKHESMVWNATDLKKFPIKIEQSDNGTQVTMLFRDISFSTPAGELFDPPADATKYDSMQGMMQQLMMKRFGGGAAPRGQ